MSLQALFSGTRAAQQWEVDWGDGNCSIYDQRSLNFDSSHYYTESGTYDISLNLIDTHDQTYEYSLISYSVPGEVKVQEPEVIPVAISLSIEEPFLFTAPLMLGSEDPITGQIIWHSVYLTGPFSDPIFDISQSALELLPEEDTAVENLMAAESLSLSAIDATAFYSEGDDWGFDFSLSDQKENSREINEEKSFLWDAFDCSFL